MNEVRFYYIMYSIHYVCFILIEKLSNKPTLDKKTVAFMATATGLQSNMVDKQVIQFNHVISNEGVAYDKSTGMFTTPVDGIYNFQTTIRTYNNVEIWGHIDVNESPKVWFNARASDNRHDSGSQSLVISLSKGDKVTVRNHGGSGTLFGGHYTSFSGFMISSHL